MCSINFDESATHMLKSAQSSRLLILFAGKLDSLRDHLDN
jgi:hypothetical protein